MDKTRINFLLNQGKEFYFGTSKGGDSCWGLFFKGGNQKFFFFFFSVDAFQHSIFPVWMQGFFVTTHVMTSGFTRIKYYYTRWALLLVTNALVAPNKWPYIWVTEGFISPLWVKSTTAPLPTLSGDLYGWHQGSSREGSPGDPHRAEGVAVLVFLRNW